MLRALLVAFALVSTVSLAAADLKPTPPAKEEVSAADAEKFLVFFNAFADAVVNNKSDCKKMGTSLDAVITKHAATIKMANDAKAANKRLPKAVEEKMAVRLKAMAPAMMTCKDDAGVAKALGRLPGPGAARKSAPPPSK